MPFNPIQGVPAIPPPGDSVESLMQTTNALKQGLENITGRSGDPLDRVVTLRDLLQLRIITTPDMQASSPHTELVRRPEIERLRARLKALDGLPY